MTGNATSRKSLRFAYTLNLLFPGAGQLYLGQTVLSVIHMVGFVSIFAAILTLFLRAYTRYLELSTSGDIFEGDHLEELSHAFPVGWLVGLTLLAILILCGVIVELAEAELTASSATEITYPDAPYHNARTRNW